MPNVVALTVIIIIVIIAIIAIIIIIIILDLLHLKLLPVIQLRRGHTTKNGTPVDAMLGDAVRCKLLLYMLMIQP